MTLTYHCPIWPRFPHLCEEAIRPDRCLRASTSPRRLPQPPQGKEESRSSPQLGLSAAHTHSCSVNGSSSSPSNCVIFEQSVPGLNTRTLKSTGRCLPAVVASTGHTQWRRKPASWAVHSASLAGFVLPAQSSLRFLSCLQGLRRARSHFDKN